jgi:Domain of unknown function (DUF4384)
MRRIILPAIILMLALAVTGWAVERVTVTATGEAAIANISPEEAQKQALQKARVNAVETACGVKVQSDSFVKDYMLQGDFIHAVSYGQIISEKIDSWKVEMEQENPKLPPSLTYLVTIRAEVLKERGESDPSYRTKVRLNKSVYNSGDEMVIYVGTTKPSYITVLNFTADDRVILLFPNGLRRDNKIEGGKEYQIPSPADRDGVLKLQVSNLPGHKRDTEYIKVIATKKPINLLEGILMQGQYGVMDTLTLAVTEIAKLIAAIPVKDRAEATAVYQIVNTQ